MKDGTILRFKGEGSQSFGKHVGDLVVCLKQKEHAKFSRNGNDLIYRHNIDLADALLSEAIELHTIDGQAVKYRSESIITPHTTKLFKGMGMPVYTDDPLSPLMIAPSRGNLVLKFHIRIPAMSNEQRDRLIAALE
jgi:DnaJ-class molecular chaperone